MHATHEEGLVLLSQLQYAVAKSLFQEVFKSRKHTLGRHHEDTLASLSALGNALLIKRSTAKPKLYTEMSG